jgi:hypothetical protein
VNENLDLTVAQAVFTTKLLERALHDHGPWTLSWGPFEVPVIRQITDVGVTFVAEFPAHCFLEPPHPVAILRCDGEAVAAKTIDFPGDGGFTVEWTLRARVVETPA